MGTILMISDNVCPNIAPGKVVQTRSEHAFHQTGMDPCHTHKHYVDMICHLGYKVHHEADLTQKQLTSLLSLHQIAKAKQHEESIEWLEAIIDANKIGDLGWIEFVGKCTNQ